MIEKAAASRSEATIKDGQDLVSGNKIRQSPAKRKTKKRTKMPPLGPDPFILFLLSFKKY